VSAFCIAAHWAFEESTGDARVGSEQVETMKCSGHNLQLAWHSLQVGGSAGTRYRLWRQAWALSLLFVFAILGAVLHAGVAHAANPWATPERPYPHTRATGQRMIYGPGTLSGTFNKYVRVELAVLSQQLASSWPC
jgi:hypothetical protein